MKIDAVSNKKKYEFLFIDDSPRDNKYLSLLIRIKKLPIQPHFEYNAIKAIDYLKSCDKTQFPKVIFVDIKMPLMNGFEFVEAYLKLKQFEEIGKDTLVYITSSSILAADREKAAQHLNITDFIAKPFNLKQFEEKVLSQLDKTFSAPARLPILENSYQLIKNPEKRQIYNVS